MPKGRQVVPKLGINPRLLEPIDIHEMTEPAVTTQFDLSIDMDWEETEPKTLPISCSSFSEKDTTPKFPATSGYFESNQGACCL